MESANTVGLIMMGLIATITSGRFGFIHRNLVGSSLGLLKAAVISGALVIMALESLFILPAAAVGFSISGSFLLGVIFGNFFDEYYG